MARHSNVRKLPSGRFQGRYKGADGKFHGKTFDTADEASRWVTAQRGDVHAGEWVNPQLGETLFREWWTTHTTARLNVRASTKAKEAALSRTHLLPAFGDLPLKAISHAKLQDWVNELTDGLKPSSVRSTVQTMNKAMQAAVNARMLKANPCVGLTLPRVEREEKRFLTTTEVARLHRHMDERYKALVLLGCYGGLRIGELAGLDRRHINVLARSVRIEQTATEVTGNGIVVNPPKTLRSRRTITVPRFVAEALAEHLENFVGPEPTSHVFSAPGGGRLMVNNFRRREWKAAREAAGLGSLRVHDMRHTAVALWISTGVPALLVSQQAGHSSVAFTLDTYGHLFPNVGNELADRLDAMNGFGTGDNVIPFRAG